MPVSAQEHRVRTGLYRSCKGVWLSRHETNHFSQTAETRSRREVTECDTFDLRIIGFFVTVMLLVPLMYTAFIVAMTILEVLLQIRLSSDKGVVYDVSHQARLDLSSVIDVYHLVIKIFFWLVQHRRMVTLFSLLCVFLISTVTAVVSLIIRHRYKQTVHRVVIVLQGGKIVDVQKGSTGHFSQRLMCVSLLVAILTAILISLMLIKSGDVELNPGPVTVLTIDSHLLPIKDAIWEARSHWKEIGLRLGLTDSDINGIHEVYDGECLHQVLSMWIHTGRATIHDLLAALEHKTVNQKNIADEIRALRGKERKDIGLDTDEETVQNEVQGIKYDMSQLDEMASVSQVSRTKSQTNRSPLPPVNRSVTTSSTTTVSEFNPSTSQSNTTEPPPLSLTADFHLVYETLYPACPNWYNLGLALNLSPPTLESIKIENREKPSDCLRDILLTRMKMMPKLTWREIIEVLRQPSFGERDLALRIERKYYHCAGHDKDSSPLDKMQSALSGEPTLEELCSLPVDNVWHSLGLWLGVEERRLWEIKKKTDNKKRKMFEAFISTPVGTKKYHKFIRSIPQRKRTIVESFFESKVPQNLDEYKQIIKELPEDQKKIGEELLQQKLSKYQQLVRALVKVGKREIAEEICAKKGVSLTDYLAITDPASNPPECVIKYASYLKDRYKQMSVIPDTDWPPAIGTKQHFTNLALIERERDHRPDFEESQAMAYDYAHGNIDNIVARKKDVKLEEVFLPIIDKSSKESRLTILMDGAPGVGKTTITRKVCIDWANGKILQEYQLVIFVPLREVTLNQVENHTIADLLPADDPELKAKISQHIQKTSGANILFLFDGFDELSTQQRTKQSLFLNIIKGNTLYYCSVLVTSRTYASVNLRWLNRINRHIEVLGFSKKQIRHCVHQSLPPREGNQLLRKLKERLDIQSLCYIPLISRIVLFVYGQHYELPSTLTQLYEIFLLHTVKHHAEKITSDVTIIDEIREATSIDELPQFVQTQLDDLSKLAYIYISIKEDELIFTSKELNKPKEVLSLGLLNTFPCFTTAGLMNYYQFLHLTIQEFLAARHLMSDTMSNKSRTKFIKRNMDNKRYRMALLFVAGLSHFSFLSSEESLLGETTLDLSSSEEKEFFLFLAQLVYESHTSVSIMSTLITKLDLSDRMLTQFDCLVLANFLSTTPPNHIWEDINLSSCGLTSAHATLQLFSKVHVTRGIPGIVMTRSLNIENNPEMSISSILPVISKDSYLEKLFLPFFGATSFSSCVSSKELVKEVVNHKSLQTVSFQNRRIVISKQSINFSEVHSENQELCSFFFQQLVHFLDPNQVQIILLPGSKNAFQDCPHCKGSGSDSVTSLCQLIDKSTNLQKIDFSQCKLSRERMTLINNALANKTTLESINLEGNDGTKIQPEEAQLLGRILNGIDPTKLAGSGISAERLLQGDMDSDLPLEQVQFNLRKIPEVAHIADNLGEYLKSRL